MGPREREGRYSKGGGIEGDMTMVLVLCCASDTPRRTLDARFSFFCCFLQAELYIMAGLLVIEGEARRVLFVLYLLL